MRFLISLALLAAAAAPAAAQDDLDKVWTKIQPARAVYVLRQRGAPESNGAVAMSGRMVVEARLTCTELATSLTMEIRASSSGQTMSVKLEQKSSETRDGKIYRFSSVTSENGRENDGESTSVHGATSNVRSMDARNGPSWTTFSRR